MISNMPRSTALARTDEKSLTSSDPIELLEQAEVLRRRAEQSFAEYALEAGRLLIAAKRKIKHGEWANAIASTTGYSLRSCEVYMRAYKRWRAMSEGERQEALQRPFSRSLLVLAQAPKEPAPEVIEAMPRQATQPNGTQAASREQDLETTRLLLYSSLEGHERSQVFFERVFADFYRVVSGYIRRRIDEGVFRRVNADIAARALIGAISYPGLVDMLFPIRSGRSGRKRAARETVEIFLGGITAR